MKSEAENKGYSRQRELLMPRLWDEANYVADQRWPWKGETM